MEHAREVSSQVADGVVGGWWRKLLMPYVIENRGSCCANWLTDRAGNRWSGMTRLAGGGEGGEQSGWS